MKCKCLDLIDRRLAETARAAAIAAPRNGTATLHVMMERFNTLANLRHDLDPTGGRPLFVVALEEATRTLKRESA